MNLQQLPKHPKIEGQPSRFRETFVPHKPDAVIVSMDFAAQELRVIADYSKDKNMLACFVGDNKKDMHALTGVGILKKSQPGKLESLIESLGIADLDRGEAEYTAFCSMESSQDAALKPLYKEYRSLGKKVNFTTEYGAAAPKLAMTMLIDEDTAQSYIDAREAVFSEAKEWKQAVVAEAKAAGFVKTKLGAVRHLAALLTSDDKFTASKAERQAVNFKIQSSSAEMTKKAEGRMWRAELTKRYDATYLGPIHDETVWSVSKSDLADFMVECHKCMVAPYADMVVPIESSISFGPDFGTQYEIGSVASQEAINDGFAQWAKAA